MTRSMGKPRAGFTMLEMLTVLTVFSLLLTISVSWLHYSMSFASTTKKRQRYHQNLKRLASEFRGDVRQCQQMSLVSPNELQLIVDEKRVTIYKIVGMNVELVKTDNEIVTFRDRYDLGPQSLVRWNDSEMPEWIELLVERCPPGTVQIDGNPRSQASAARSQNPALTFELTPPIDLHVRVRPNAWR